MRTLLCAVAAVAACDSPADYDFFDACDARAAPDAACYAARRDPASDDVALALAIARRYVDEHPVAELRWGWEDGVLLYAMTELARVTGDAGIAAYYRDFIDQHLDRYDLVWSDSCPPALAAIARYAETGDARYAAVARDVLRYLDETALRTDDGGISHLGVLDVRTLWIDSLFMFGMVLNRWAEVGGDRGALGEMRDQLAIFGRRLQAPGGLFVHADGWPEPQEPDVFWARGNAWVTVATADYLRVRALRHQGDAAAEDRLAAQVAAVLAAQDATGAWHTVVNRPESYLETSATALFAYGMARGYRYGAVGDEVLPAVASAVAAVRAAIARDEAGRPVVTGISGPTIVGTYASYAEVPRLDDASYGVGAAILALIEASGLPEAAP
jgi:unsaturated rhamnogalacturonyl hydrolase